MAKRKPKNHYGEGSIFYSNVKQKWMAQIYIGKDENGKVIRKSVTGKVILCQVPCQKLAARQSDCSHY